MPSGNGSGGFGPGSSARFAGQRAGGQGGRNNSFRYPSPWWDVAQLDLPRSVKHLFQWCLYHALVNPLVSSVTRKMAAYPITEITILEEPEEGFSAHHDRWKDALFQTLDVRSFQLEVGLDFYTYGNCIVSILFPFHKYLECRACGARERIKRLKFRKDWNFRDHKYILTCPKCRAVQPAKVDDVHYPSYKGIKLIRWNPADIDIDFNPITRQPEYAYKAPQKLKTKVIRKTQSYLEDLPHALIKSLKTGRPFIIDSRNVYHFKNPTPSLAANDDGWGYPPILPALKDSFYLQILKKSQEAVMLEHLIPLDIFFPASSDANANPYSMINLSDWKSRVEKEIVKWRWDPNYKPILPVPIGHQRVGGNGRALMLTQEIRAWSEHIVAGMGVPQEFAFGGLSWSGSNVSLRMLENQFMTYRQMHQHFLQHFLIPHIARFMGWSEIKVNMREFKMADDIQGKQLLLSLNQMKKVSDKTLLAEFGKDALAESKIIEQELQRSLELQKTEQMYGAKVQGEVQEMQAKRQQQLQALMGAGQPAPGQPPAAMQPNEVVQGMSALPNSVNVLELADAYAKKLSNMDPAQSADALRRIRAQSPELHQVVQQKMSLLQAQGIKPLPEQRPPRREDKVI